MNGRNDGDFDFAIDCPLRNLVSTGGHEAVYPGSEPAVVWPEMAVNVDGSHTCSHFCKVARG